MIDCRMLNINYWVWYLTACQWLMWKCPSFTVILGQLSFMNRLARYGDLLVVVFHQTYHDISTPRTWICWRLSLHIVPVYPLRRISWKILVSTNVTLLQPTTPTLRYIVRVTVFRGVHRYSVTCRLRNLRARTCWATVVGWYLKLVRP